MPKGVRRTEFIPCDVEGCTEEARTRGKCKTHYMREYRHGDPNFVIHPQKRGEVCSFEDCGRPHQANGYCAAHDHQRAKGKPLTAIREYVRQGDTCMFEGCGDKPKSKGYCDAHLWQLSQGRELAPKRVFAAKGGPCAANDCPRPATVERMCRRHRIRFLADLPHWDAPIENRRPIGEGTIEDGYRIISVDGKRHREHRWNAEQELGRPLRPNEDVHHSDTNRLNNATDGPFELNDRGRLVSGNLEVWAYSHPRGGEIGPQIEWALDTLKTYADVLPAGVVDQLTHLVGRLTGQEKPK